MSATAFEILAKLALTHSGQAFTSDKRYLMDARLETICRRENFATLEDLVQCLIARPNPRFEYEVAAALTTKHTYFFRERDLINRLVEHALPERLKSSNTGRLRVWCAGVSSGQEAYSLAMALADCGNPALSNGQIEIVATDISEQTLQFAKTGRYGHYDVQKGLSIQRLLAHFEQLDTGEWQINETLQKRVTFRAQNLLKSADTLGKFDVIICANTLTHMDEGASKTAAKTLARALYPKAWLFAGQSETFTGLVDGLEPARDMRSGYGSEPKHNFKSLNRIG